MTSLPYSELHSEPLLKELPQRLDELFPTVIGNFPAKLALILNLLDPKCGGVLIVGKRGTGKTLILKSFRTLLEELSLPYTELPCHVDEESLFGSLDLERTLKEGKVYHRKGLLERAKDTYLLIDDLHLLPPDLLPPIFQKIHDFTLISTLAPEESNLSPHFLDRIGLVAPLEELTSPSDRRLLLEKLGDLKERARENGPAKKGPLLSQLLFSRELVKKMGVSSRIWNFIIERVEAKNITTHRAEIFYFFAGRAFAGLLKAPCLKEKHLLFVEPLVLAHRAKLPKERESPTSESTDTEKGEEEEAIHLSLQAF